MSASDDAVGVIADRMAVTDVVLRFFNLVDSKEWERMHEVFTDDTTVRRGPDTLIEGRSAVVGGMQQMVDNDEIVTYHHVATMTPVIDGDNSRGHRAGPGHAQRRGPALRQVLREPRRPAHPLDPNSRRLAHQASGLADPGKAWQPGGTVRTRAGGAPSRPGSAPIAQTQQTLG